MAADLSQYEPIFQAAGTEWNVDPTLLKAVAAQESGGNASAVSSKNAQGLMQIVPDTQKLLGITDPTDPVQSIYGAAKYLSAGLDAEGSPQGALLYYHGGPNWRQSFGSESAAYVPGVARYYAQFSKPAQDSAPQASSSSTPQPQPPQGPLILGDSLASKGGLGGSGVVGASPAAVLSSIQNLDPAQVNGRDVILSSGASNNPASAGLLEGQIKALNDKGARSVNVVGVGNSPKLDGVNDTLSATAAQNGARFVPIDPATLGPDGVHPTTAGYKALLAAATPTAAPAPTGSTTMASDADILKLLPPAPQAAAPTATPATPAAAPASDSDILKLLPPAPTPAPTPAMPSSPMPGLPPDADPGDIFPPADNPVTSTGKAIAEGWQASPSLVTPETRSAIDQSKLLGLDVGRYIYNPLLDIGGGILGAGNALLRGGQNFVSQVAPQAHVSLPEGVTIPLGGGRQLSGELTPGSLGRELAALPEAFPTGGSELSVPGRPPIAEPDINTLTQPRFVQEYYGEGTPSNPLASGPDPANLTRSQQLIGAVRRATPADTSQLPPGAPAVPAPAPYQPPSFVPPGTSPYPANAPRAVDAPPRPTGGDFMPLGGADTPVGAPPAATPSTTIAAATPAAPVAPTGPILTSAQAKQVAGAYYNQADQSGGVLTPKVTDRFIDNVAAAAPQTAAGQVVLGQSPVSALVERLQGLRGQPLTLQAAQEIDEGLGNLIDQQYGPRGLTKDGKQLSDIQQGFRDQIQNAGPDDIVGGSDGFDALGLGRQAWSQAMKLSDLERIQQRADLTDNPATSVRTQIRTILTNPARARGYSPEELAALKDAAERGVVGSALHVFGSRLIPLAAGAATWPTGGILGALAGAGISHVGTTMLRNWAGNIASNRLRNAQSTIGGNVPAPPNQLTPPPP